MKVRRYFAVTSPKAEDLVLHRYYGVKMVEGERTACGIAMGAGWLFWIPKHAPRLHYKHCLRCERTK
jgi:hypothetical protein